MLSEIVKISVKVKSRHCLSKYCRSYFQVKHFVNPTKLLNILSSYGGLQLPYILSYQVWKKI